MWRHSMLVSLVVGSACGGARSEPVAQPSGPGEAASETVAAPAVPPVTVQDLHFAWPAPAQVAVVETVNKQGQRSRVAYALVIERVGGEFHIAYQDFRYLAVAGLDLNNPANAAAARQLNALGRALPTLVVDANGQLIRVVGLERTIQASLRALEESRPNKEAVAKVRAMMTSEAFRAAAERKAGDPWNSWVQLWTLEDLPQPGEETDYEAGEGMHVTLANRGAQPDGTLRLEMRGRRRFPPEYLSSVVGSALGPEFAELQATLSHGEIASAAWVDTTATLQPRRAHMATTVALVGKDGATRERVESHDYEFTW